MGARHRQDRLGLDRQIMRVEPMQIGPVDRINRAIAMGQDGAAPDMLTAGQFGRSGKRRQAIAVDSLDPTERRRPAECRHGAAKKPFARLAPDHHDVPAIVAAGGYPGRAGDRAKFAGGRLLATIAAAFHRPRSRPITGLFLIAIPNRGHIQSPPTGHTGSLKKRPAAVNRGAGPTNFSAFRRTPLLPSARQNLAGGKHD